jgi:hypothetical protein
MMTRKNIIIVSSAVAGIAVISVGLATSLRGEKGPAFAGKKPDEIEAYFESEAFRNMSKKDQIAIKKKAYAPIYLQREREFIEQAKTYAKLPPRQKVVYLDRMIDKFVSDAEQKQKIASNRTQGAETKSGNSKRAEGKASSAKKTFAPEDIRAWSEKMEPEKRAPIMALKEALRQRMKQRGIEMQ